MSGAIAQALETAAHKIGQALGRDAAGAVTKLHHTTADNLAKSSAAHVEHDTQAARRLEAAAKHDTTIHNPHGAAGLRQPTSVAASGVDSAAEMDRLQIHAGSEVPPDLYLETGYRPNGDLSVDQFQAKYKLPNGYWDYPPNAGGVLGTEVIDPALPKGYTMDRFGDEKGRFLSPQGTPFPDRALPPDSLVAGYHTYTVTGSPLPDGYHIIQAEVAPWFEQPGGGTQFEIIGPGGTRATVQQLVDRGYLE